MSNESGAAAVETHSAAIFFLGDRAYKVKKPVDLGFLDFRTVEARAEACRREVELNRRLAPDVYLGVAQVADADGEVCEHMVVLRRMPPDRRLRRCLERGEDVAATIRQVARDIASLHDSSPPAGQMSEVATRDAVLRRWTDGFDLMRPHLGGDLRTATQERIEELVGRYLAGRAHLFDERIAAGSVRDGHGDLQAEDIFVLDDGPRVLDCLEFDDELRWGDVMSDVAFLAMDLERLGRADLARLFLDSYQHLSGNSWPASLEHHYTAFRAHVRAKVGLVRESQTGERMDEVDDLLALCLRHLESGRIRLVLVGGLPGTGKSTVARMLADRVGAVMMRSDELRRRRPEQGRYEPATTEAVYSELLAEAERHLGLGRSVVLDATWSTSAHRALARAAADRAVADLVEIECTAPTEVTHQRIRRRLETGTDPSEATPAVADAMAERFDAWPEAARIETDRSTDESFDDVLRALG